MSIPWVLGCYLTQALGMQVSPRVQRKTKTPMMQSKPIGTKTTWKTKVYHQSALVLKVYAFPTVNVMDLQMELLIL